MKESQAFRRQAELKAIIYYLFKNWFKMSASGNKNFFTTCVARFSEYRVHVALKSLKLDFQCMQGLSSEKM